MDVLAVLLLIVVIYLIVSAKSGLSQKIADLEHRIINLQSHLKKMQETQDKPITKATTPEAAKPQAETAPRQVPQPETPKPEPPKPQPTVEWDKRIISPPERAEEKARQQPPQYRPFIREPEKSFFERYPDLEKFIGENLINKIGIGILVLAIGYFVKYAIDNNWIGPWGRVSIGVLCGSILVGLAHKLRKNYTAFSSVLAGGGLAIYYFIVTLAFQEFQLFSQTTAFIVLIVITVFAVALSLLYDKQELAIIALVGGMASPFMVSNGHNNFNAFFIYLLVLNAGLLVLAYYKAWRILNISAFALTALVYITVVCNMEVKDDHIAFLFGTLFYLLFLAINLANNIKEGKAFIASDYSILLINTALYFSAGLYLLTQMGQQDYRGLFSASLGAVNLALSYVLFRNKKVDTNILYLLIGITLTFISLTAPIQLHGNNITLFWASETVLLYWLYQKSGIKLMKLTSLLVWLLMLGSLGLDWMNVYGDNFTVLTVMANKGFITTVFAAISSYLLFILVQKDGTEERYSWEVPVDAFRIAAFVLLFLSGVLEINHQFQSHYPNTSLNVVYLMLYVPAFIWVFSKFVLSRMEDVEPYVGTALVIATIVCYLAFIPDAFDVQRLMLEKHTPDGAHFIAHWAGAIFTGLLFYRLIAIFKNGEDTADFVWWIMCAGIVAFLSFEVSLLSNHMFYSTAYPFDQVETVYIKTGLPVLWGLSSFAIMWLGMRYKQRTLRVISLSLFTLTLLKLFIFDIRDIPAAGKIAAFFCLGVLLLIVSFMYQKVKKIIVADESAREDI